MKVKEIRELLNRISEVHGEKYDDWNLTVITNDPSMGGFIASASQVCIIRF